MNLRSVLFVSALAVAGASHADTIADWTFENLPTTGTSTALNTGMASGPYAAEIGLGTATALHTSATTAYSAPSGNGTAKALSSNAWAVGDYYQFATSTSGMSKIGLTFDQTGSGTGPRDFKVSYSTNGTTFTDFGTYSVALSTWNPTTTMTGFTQTFDFSGVSVLNNAPTVYFRIVDNSTTSISGATVASGGTGRLDGVTVTGTAQAVPEPSAFAALGLGALALVRRRRSAK